MRRTYWYTLLVMLAAIVPPASALQLHWSTGSTEMTFTGATRCTLVVQADSSESRLPPEWRLLWVADSSSVQFVAPDLASACALDEAQVSSFDRPVTPADSAAHLATAHFCSVDNNAAMSALQVVDLPAGGRGKFKAVALDPADPDSSRIIESNEATFNAGITATYVPAILRVTSDHSTTTLRVEAFGADLAGVQAVRISAPELQTEVPLAIESFGPASVVARTIISVPLPNSSVLFETPQGVMPSGQIPADVVEAAELPDEAFFSDPAGARPKDFAFINAPTPVAGVWRNLFHIYYIRHLTDPGTLDSLNEITLGHAWSRDLIHWEQTANSLDAFPANTSDVSAWDHSHVWAPSIVQFGTKFLMYYTGVAENRDQTIGFASADSLYTTSPSSFWSRQSAPVFSPPNANSWVSQNHPWQFRDPYVMPDPQNPTSQLLMFYTAKQKADSGFAVGVARSFTNNATQWTDLGFYPTTDQAHTFIGRLESPHVFPDSINRAPAQDFAATWRIMFTMGDWNFPDTTRIVFFVTKVTGTDVTDRTASHWSTTPTNLYDYLHLTSASPEFEHQASEVLNLSGTYFWAGFNDVDIRFRRVVWGGTNQFWLTNVGEIVGVQGKGTPKALRLAIAGLSPSRGLTRFRIDMPARIRTSIVVYDVMGRRVRSLIDREIMPGLTEVTWDGRDQAGAAVGTGMYFARMVAVGTSQVVRVPLVR